jgi:hypothetical protein
MAGTAPIKYTSTMNERSNCPCYLRRKVVPGGELDLSLAIEPGVRSQITSVSRRCRQKCGYKSTGLSILPQSKVLTRWVSGLTERRYQWQN